MRKLLLLLALIVSTSQAEHYRLSSKYGSLPKGSIVDAKFCTSKQCKVIYPVKTKIPLSLLKPMKLLYQSPCYSKKGRVDFLFYKGGTAVCVYPDRKEEVRKADPLASVSLLDIHGESPVLKWGKEHYKCIKTFDVEVGTVDQLFFKSRGMKDKIFFSVRHLRPSEEKLIEEIKHFSTKSHCKEEISDRNVSIEKWVSCLKRKTEDMKKKYDELVLRALESSMRGHMHYRVLKGLISLRKKI